MTDKILNVRELADDLKVSESFIYRHAAELGAAHVGGALRFRQSDVDRWFDEQRLQPARREVTRLGRIKRAI